MTASFMFAFPLSLAYGNSSVCAQARRHAEMEELNRMRTQVRKRPCIYANHMVADAVH